MKARGALVALALLVLGSCAGRTEVPLHFWPPDAPVRPFLDGSETEAAAVEEDGRELQQYVVLLPDANGEVGVVEVSDGETIARLDQPYQAVRFDNLGETYHVDPPQEEASEFSAAIIHEPPPPATFVVYFEFDSTRMTEASKSAMEAALADIRRRAAPQVWLSGHADRTGSDDRNMGLSRRRAEAVAALLQQVGVAAEVMTVRWHGEQRPVVASGDGVREPRNRRVAITVR